MTEHRHDRRSYIKGVGAVGTAALSGLAGCSGGGGSGGGGTTTGTSGDGGGTSAASFRYGTVGSEKTNSLDSVDPYGAWTLADRLKKRGISMDIIGSAQLCGESDCVLKIRNDIVQSGTTSVGNTTKFSPENNIWALPYLFPARNRAAQMYSIFHEEAWKRYWVPFAKKYNYVPFFGYPGQYRGIHIGDSAAKEFEGDRMTLPKHIEGLDIRRTVSRIPAKAIKAWGAKPVQVSWGDTIQGLKSGLVGGLETWYTNVAAYGMVPSISQTIKNQWGLGIEMSWVNVNWLKGLPEKQRQILAEETRKITNELAHLADEVVSERAGAVSPPPEGTSYGKNGVKVNELSDDELSAWREKVAYKQHPDMYAKTFEEAGQILGGADKAREFADFLWRSSREKTVPSSPDKFEVSSWWDDHLAEI